MRWMLSARFAAQAITWAITILVVRILDPSDYGLMAMATVPIGFLALLDGTVTTPVNIRNPVEFTMLELAELVVELTGSTAGIVHEPQPVDDPRKRRPDITLARERLGWQPTVDLRAGLEEHLEVVQVFRIERSRLAGFILRQRFSSAGCDKNGYRDHPQNCHRVTTC